MENPLAYILYLAFLFGNKVFILNRDTKGKRKNKKFSYTYFIMMGYFVKSIFLL